MTKVDCKFLFILNLLEMVFFENLGILGGSEELSVLNIWFVVAMVLKCCMGIRAHVF